MKGIKVFGLVLGLLILAFAVLYFYDDKIIEKKYSEKTFSIFEEEPIIENKDLENSEEIIIDELQKEYNELVKKDIFKSIDKLHWTHMPLVYKFVEPKCNEYKRSNIIKAFEQINIETNNSVYFIEGEEEDISIICSVTPKDERQLQEGVERLGETYYNFWGDMILNATIIFYPTITSCGYYPFVQIHEILHTFNYDHTKKPCSIMYSGTLGTDNCRFIYENQDICGNPHIDKEIIEDLINTYN